MKLFRKETAKTFLVILVFALISCGGGGGSSSSGGGPEPETTNPSVENTNWGSIVWDEGRWQ